MEPVRPLESMLRRIVRSLDPGGQSKYARIVGKHQSTISERLKGAGEILADEVVAVSAATGIPKAQLRPDIFGEPVDDHSAALSPSARA